MLLGRIKLTICDEVVLSALRLGEQRVLLRELLLAGTTHTAPKHFLPHPIDLEIATLPALLALGLVGDGAESRLERPGLLPLQLPKQLHPLPLRLSHVLGPLRLIRVDARALPAAPG